MGFGYVQRIVPVHRAVELDQDFLQAASPRTVVAGDSHARNAVDASALDGAEAINIAVGGETWLKTRYRLPWLLDQRPHTVSRVVLGMDHASPSGWKVDSWEPEAVWGRYVSWPQLAEQRNRPFAMGGRALKANVAPYAGELDTLLQLLTGTRAFQVEGGPRLQPPRHRRRLGAAAADAHFRNTEAIDATLLWAVEGLVAELQARDIDVVFVAYPMSRGYLERLEPLGVTDPWTHPRLEALLDRPGVSFFDYSRAMTERPEWFYDGDHVNGTGRRMISRRLAVDLATLDR